MAKSITASDVSTAALRILQRGETPTIERVRNELGGGSNTTIHRYLNDWRKDYGERLKASSGAQIPSTFPQELYGPFQLLWETAVNEATTRFGAAKEGYESALALKDKQINEQLEELANLKSINEEQNLEIKAFQETISNLQVQLVESHSEIKTKQIVNDNLESELRKAQHNIEVLKRTHAQELASAQACYQKAIDEAHERLVGVQNHMLLQISEARDETNRYKSEAEREKTQLQRLFDQALTRADAAIQALQAEKTLLLEKNTQLHNALHELRSSEVRLNKTIQESSGKIQHFETQNQALTERLENLIKEEAKASEIINTIMNICVSDYSDIYFRHSRKPEIIEVRVGDQMKEIGVDRSKTESEKLTSLIASLFDFFRKLKPLLDKPRSQTRKLRDKPRKQH